MVLRLTDKSAVRLCDDSIKELKGKSINDFLASSENLEEKRKLMKELDCITRD